MVTLRGMLIILALSVRVGWSQSDGTEASSREVSAVATDAAVDSVASATAREGVDSSVAEAGHGDTLEPVAAIDSLDPPQQEPTQEPRILRSSAAGGRVLVTGQKRHKRKQVSAPVLSRDEISKVVATAQDPLRSLPTLPGVSASSDLSVRPLVRGGDLTETGVELDGVPLLMPYHYGSVFSVFHREAIDDFRLYTGVAPASTRGMLSGTVLAHSRPPLADTTFGGMDISLLRGSGWMNIPPWPDRVGMWISGQSLWYDWTTKRFMDLAAYLGAAGRDDVERWKATNTLPTTWDVQGGLSVPVGSSWMLEFGGYVAGDEYRVLDRIKTYWVDGKEIPSPQIVAVPKNWDNPDSGSTTMCWSGSFVVPCPEHVVEKVRLDTSAIVELSSRMMHTRLRWTPDPDFSIEGVAAWQQVDWDVRFPGERQLVEDAVNGGYRATRVGDGETFDWRRNMLSLDLSARKMWSDEHQTSAGVGWGRGREIVRTHLSRPLAHLIMGTTGNPMEFLGFFNEDEILVATGRNSSYLDQKRLEDLDFDYDASWVQVPADLWIEQQWDPGDDTRVRAGLRMEDGSSGWNWPDPRVQIQHQLGENDLLGLGVGLHTQNELPFEWRLSASEPLVPEKVWMTVLEWEHTFAPGWRSTVSGWGKYYQDLASPSLERYGEVDTNAYTQELWQYINEHQSEFPDSLRSFTCPEGSTMDSCDELMAQFRAKVFEWVPASTRSSIHDWMMSKRLRYASTGIGFATGLEASLRFQPAQAWTGWGSLEWSVSRRRDRPDGQWVPFALQHPWKATLVNAFRIDRTWELSVRYTAMGGNPYTPFKFWDDEFGDTRETVPDGSSGADEVDTVLWIGARNSGTLAPYQRLDLRLSRGTTIWGQPATYYYEIWNALNDPNMILRDAETGQFLWVQWNVPFPVMFVGLEMRF